VQIKLIVLVLTLPVLMLLLGYIIDPAFNNPVFLENNIETKKISLKLTETFDEEKIWVPSTIYLKKGDIVEFTIINGDDNDNIQLLIPDLDVTSDIIPPLNGYKTLTFRADNVGEYSFYSEETCVPIDSGDLEECDNVNVLEENNDEPSIVGKIIIEE